MTGGGRVAEDKVPMPPAIRQSKYGHWTSSDLNTFLQFHSLCTYSLRGYNSACLIILKPLDIILSYKIRTPDAT